MYLNPLNPHKKRLELELKFGYYCNITASWRVQTPKRGHSPHWPQDLLMPHFDIVPHTPSRFRNPDGTRRQLARAHAHDLERDHRHLHALCLDLGVSELPHPKRT